jgi:predicted nucleic acid-binding protein
VKRYFDSAYIAKCYLTDPDSEDVRDLVRTCEELWSCSLAIAEVACAIHRRFREGHLTRRQASDLAGSFRRHVEEGVWQLQHVDTGVLFDVEDALRSAGRAAFLRAGDAIHLAAARSAGFAEIWSNDRHLLAAARVFGLSGKTV